MLRTHKLGEADRIVTLLTRYHGQIRAVAKGVRKTTSRFGTRLEPFMVADVQFYQGKSLDTVNQAETLGSYGSEIVADYQLYTAANVMELSVLPLVDVRSPNCSSRIQSPGCTPPGTSVASGCGSASSGRKARRSVQSIATPSILETRASAASSVITARSRTM